MSNSLYPIKNPKGWEIVTIGDVVTEVRYGTSKPAVEGGKYPYLRMNNLTADGHLDLNDLKYIDIPDDEIENVLLEKEIYFSIGLIVLNWLEKRQYLIYQRIWLLQDTLFE